MLTTTASGFIDTEWTPAFQQPQKIKIYHSIEGHSLVASVQNHRPLRKVVRPLTITKEKETKPQGLFRQILLGTGLVGALGYLLVFNRKHKNSNCFNKGALVAF